MNNFLVNHPEQLSPDGDGVSSDYPNEINDELIDMLRAHNATEEMALAWILENVKQE